MPTFIDFINSHYLSILTFMPLMAVVILFMVPANDSRRLRNIAFLASLVVFIFSLKLLTGFNMNEVNIQFAEKYSWIANYGVSWFVGIDGISLLLIILTTFLFPLVIFGADLGLKEGLKLYLISMFILETAVIGSFVALDMLLFYLFFELMLIPMTLLIIVYGGKNRLYAGLKFFIFTMVGSIFMLVAIMVLPYLYYKTFGYFTTDLLKIYSLHIASFKMQMFLFSCFALAFAIKIPMFPVHTWLPDAHTEAPTGGSVILAGILLKVGAYGFLRFAIPLFPAAVSYLAPFFMILGVTGIIYGAVVAMIQPDMKRLVAYSSVSHMGYIVIGMFAMNSAGVTGSILQMINHGLSTGALFLLVGLIYERRHTRMIADFGGIANVMPRYAFLFMIVLLSSIAVPGLNGFIGEFMILVGTFTFSKYIGVVATLGAILGAAYMLWMYERVFYGEVTHNENKSLIDLSVEEVVQFIPIIALFIVIGIYPSLFTDRMKTSVEYLVNNRNNYSLSIAGKSANNMNIKEMIKKEVAKNERRVK